MGRAVRRIFFSDEPSFFEQEPSAWAGRLSFIGIVIIRVGKIMDESIDFPWLSLESILTELISHEWIHGILERDFDPDVSSQWDYFGNGHGETDEERAFTRVLTCDLEINIPLLRIVQSSKEV